jgi:hypothetical protein
MTPEYAKRRDYFLAYAKAHKEQKAKHSKAWRMRNGAKDRKLQYKAREKPSNKPSKEELDRLDYIALLDPMIREHRVF